VHLVDFIIKSLLRCTVTWTSNCHDARSHERQITGLPNCAPIFHFSLGFLDLVILEFMCLTSMWPYIVINFL